MPTTAFMACMLRSQKCVGETEGGRARNEGGSQGGGGAGRHSAERELRR